MYLKSLALTNFRNHPDSSFEFSPNLTFIVGPNTSGKTNLLEAISYLSLGKSVKGAREEDVVKTGEFLAKIKGNLEDTQLEVLIVLGEENALERTKKKYLVNGVSKSRINFAANIASVVFSPADLDIITGSPHLRREFLDSVLEQSDRDYHFANSAYRKALRQRNALLDTTRETGARNEKQFDYWDTLLINTGSIITQKREEFIDFINKAKKDVFDFVIKYDKSVISEERLAQYKQAEVAAGVTLVGPHRDDFLIDMFDSATGTMADIKSFGSRGQQRLVVLQLKLLQLEFIEKVLGERPLLLLDDIFSELDSSHIELVTEMVGKQQSIITTTHKEFVNAKFKKGTVIELKKHPSRRSG